jgi:phosphate transport system substrate-binding protein
MFTRISLAALAVVAAITLSAPAMAADITGAGASFPAPVYAKWASEYAKTGDKVNYQSIGSAGGIQQILAKTVDFGASDAPMGQADLDKNGLIQFPTVIGGIVPVFNLPGIKPGEIKMTGTVLADIYLGKITKWNDPALVALNAGVKLPDTEIAVVRRADGSGTTNGFTDYLSKVSADWKTKVGSGTTVNWPVGTGGKGNEGVSAFVTRLPGAIGYVEYSYAKQTKMPYASMQNAAGKYVLPTEDAFKAAAGQADWKKDAFGPNLNNGSAEGAWPITSATFILIYKQQDKPSQAEAVLKFFRWAYTNGGKLAADLDYVPMPDNVVKLIEAQWKETLKDSSGKMLSMN